MVCYLAVLLTSFLVSFASVGLYGGSIGGDEVLIMLQITGITLLWLLAFILTALGGALWGAGFFQNWLANGGGWFGGTVAAGPNPGEMGTGGTLPLMNLAVGVEVLGGISVILHCLLRAMREAGAPEPEAEDGDED